MRYYRSVWTTDEDRSIEGRRPYSIPLLTCPTCGNFRGETGLNYPWVTIRGEVPPDIERDMRYDSAADLSWERFLEMRERLRTLVKGAWPIAPGSEFGIFKGKLFKQPKLPDFAMPESDVLIARRSIVSKLNQLGCGIKFFNTKISGTSALGDELVEIWLPPVAQSAKESGIVWCANCERGIPGDREVLKVSSVPVGVHLFKLSDRPDFVCFTEKFAGHLEEFGLSGIEWEPLESMT